MPEKRAIQKVSEKFRQSQAGLKIGRMLFDPSVQMKLNPIQLTNMIKQLGIDVPSEVTITLGTAQMIMSGGAFVSDIEKGKEILQIASTGLNTLNAAVSVFQQIGLIEKDSIFGRTVSMGANLAMVLASGGLNIFADIAFIMDVVSAAIFPPDERPKVRAALAQQNYNDLLNWWTKRQTQQNIAAQGLVKAYGEKSISIFEFIGEFANQAGDSFYNYFPEYKTFIPPSLFSKYFVREQNANWGGFLFINRKTERVKEVLQYDFESFGSDRSGMVRAFIQKYITDPFAPYFMLHSLTESQVYEYGFPEDSGIKPHPKPIYPRIKPSTLAILSVMNKSFDYVGGDFDIVRVLKQLWLTPSDLGISYLISQNTEEGDYYLQSSQRVIPSALTLNGVSLSKSVRERNSKIELDRYTVKKAIEFDKAGDINSLCKIPQVYSILKEWGILPYLSPEALERLPLSYRQTSASDSLNYRNIQNYFSVLSMIEFMKQDTWLNRYGFMDMIRAVEWVVPAREAFEKQFDELYYTSTARFLNVRARENVANFFKTTQTKVEFKNNKDGTAFIVPKGR